MIVCFVPLRVRCLKYTHVVSHPVRARAKDPLSLLHPKVKREGSKNTHKKNNRILLQKKHAHHHHYTLCPNTNAFRRARRVLRRLRVREQVPRHSKRDTVAVRPLPFFSFFLPIDFTVRELWIFFFVVIFFFFFFWYAQTPGRENNRRRDTDGDWVPGGHRGRRFSALER